MDNSEIKLNITTENNTVTILQGEAPKHIEPKTVNIEGNIKAPSEYLSKNDLDKKECFLKVNYDECRLQFVIGKHNHYQDTIKGEMKESKVLNILGINSETTRTAKDLGKLLKKYRDYIYAEDFSLVGKLLKFQAKVSTVIEDSSSQSGDLKRLLEKKVETDLPESFWVKLPIYQGFDPIDISIELWAEATSNSVVFSLESMDLLSVQHAVSTSAIKEQIESFEKFGCPVIIL